MDGCFIYGGEGNKCEGSNKDLIVRCSDFLAHASLKDKTEIKADTGTGMTEIVPKFIKETNNDGDIIQEDVF